MTCPPAACWPAARSSAREPRDVIFQYVNETTGQAEDASCVSSFEVKPWGDEDADLVLAGTKRVIRRAWALLED